MFILCQAAGSILLYLFLYYIFGAVLLHLLPADDYRLPRTILIGFFFYHALFWLVTMPFKLLLKPLSYLSITWSVILLLMVILFFLTERRHLKERILSLKNAFSGSGRAGILLFLLLMAGEVLFFNQSSETYAIWDQSYYLGDSATSYYTNTISQYDAYTGRIRTQLHEEYLLETYQNHDAVMCQILHLHPMVENLTVMASVVIILYLLIFYEMGILFFAGDRLKTFCFTAFMSLLNFYSFNLYTAAEFLIIRPSEGKTIMAVLIIPVLFYLFCNVLKNTERSVSWWYSMIVILGSFGLNMSSIFMIPFELSALYIPLAIKKRSWKIFGRFILLMIPCLIFSVLYLLTKNKFFIYIGK